MPYNSPAILLAEWYDTKSNVKLGGFQSQLQVSYVSRHTRKRLTPSPTLQCSGYWKESFQVALNYSHQLLYTFVYIYTYIYMCIYTNIHIFMYFYIYIYIYIHICIFVIYQLAVKNSLNVIDLFLKLDHYCSFVGM